MAIGLQDAERSSRRKPKSAGSDDVASPQPWTSHGIAKRGRSLARERRPEGDAEPNWWLEADAHWMSLQQPLVVEYLIKPILELESEILSSTWIEDAKKPATWIRRLSQSVSRRPIFRSASARDQK